MPKRVEDTLLVVAPFRDRGTEYLPGDRVPIRHLRVRRLAAEHPSWFQMEYETEDLDLEWLAGLEPGFGEQYRALKQASEETKDRQKRALREELRSQDRREPQPELERLFKKQEAEDRRRKGEVREEREREAVEEKIAITGGNHRSGFNF